MTIYIDNGETVKIYPVKKKVAKAVSTLLETDDSSAWSETDKGYGVEIIDKYISGKERQMLNASEHEVKDIEVKTVYNCCTICHKKTDNPNPFYICDSCLAILKGRVTEADKENE